MTKIQVCRTLRRTGKMLLIIMNEDTLHSGHAAGRTWFAGNGA